MSFEDREAIAATVEETYALVGRALSTDIPSDLLATAVRPEVMREIMEARVDPYVTDEEMLQLLRTAYFDLVGTVMRLHEELLGEDSERHDTQLANVALTGSGRAVKVPGFRWMKKAFEWGNIILGSLGGVPVVGALADPIKELKESVEAQGEDDQTA